MQPPAAVLEHCQADLAAHARQRDALRGVWQFPLPSEPTRNPIRFVEPSSDLRLGESFIAGRLRGASGPIGVVESDCAGELRVRVGPENPCDLWRLARQAGRFRCRLRPGSIPTEQTVLRQARGHHRRRAGAAPGGARCRLHQGGRGAGAPAASSEAAVRFDRGGSRAR